MWHHHCYHVHRVKVCSSLCDVCTLISNPRKLHSGNFKYISDATSHTSTSHHTHTHLSQGIQFYTKQHAYTSFWLFYARDGSRHHAHTHTFSTHTIPTHTSHHTHAHLTTLACTSFWLFSARAMMVHGTAHAIPFN